MTQILHTTLIPDRTVLAAGETFTRDLPVNPLSAIIMTLRALNNGAPPAAVSGVQTFFDKYTNINVRYRGASIINGRSEDLAVAMMLRERQAPKQGQVNRTDNDTRSLTFALLFGRRMYDAVECFPATRRGDLVLSITAAADAGGLDGHSIQVETVELLDATPTRFVKITETQQAMAAAGMNDIDLPVGNKLLGVLMRPFTFPTGAAFTSSFGEISLEVDNVETIYSGINWESLQGMLARRAPPWWTDLDHIHGFVDAAAGQTDTQQGTRDTPLAQQYGYLELDPHYDGAYALDTRGAARVNIAINSDVADGANVSRVYPVELIETGAPGAAA